MHVEAWVTNTKNQPGVLKKDARQNRWPTDSTRSHRAEARPASTVISILVLQKRGSNRNPDSGIVSVGTKIIDHTEKVTKDNLITGVIRS